MTGVCGDIVGPDIACTFVLEKDWQTHEYCQLISCFPEQDSFNQCAMAR